MFVINPSVQRNTEKLNDMVLGHPLAMEHLVPALMKFYTGSLYACIHPVYIMFSISLASHKNL